MSQQTKQQANDLAIQLTIHPANQEATLWAE